MLLYKWVMHVWGIYVYTVCDSASCYMSANRGNDTKLALLHYVFHRDFMSAGRRIKESFNVGRRIKESFNVARVAGSYASKHNC